jgi:hypothetical protein
MRNNINKTYRVHNNIKFNKLHKIKIIKLNKIQQFNKVDLMMLSAKNLKSNVFNLLNYNHPFIIKIINNFYIHKLNNLK